MSVKCYEGVPSVKLIGGPSPLEGLVVLDSDRYVCYSGFNDQAAELVCGELGFPAAEHYASQTSLSTATPIRFQRLSCLDGYDRYTHVKECTSTRTDCPQNKAVRLKCQASAGFCDHPGNLSNGYWDSNITSFGSEIFFTCDKGFIIQGSPTLQCAGIPGRSTYFPVWNSSVPACRAVRNETDDNVWIDDPNNTSTTTQNAYSTLNEIQPTQDMTTLLFDITSSVSGPLEIKIKITSYTLGTFLGVVFILLAIPFVAWCYHHRKRKRRRPEDSTINAQSMQSVSPIASIMHRPLPEQPLESISPVASIVHRPLPEHPGYRSDDATPDQEGVYYSYLHSAKDHTLNGKMARDLADTVPRPPHGVVNQDGDDKAQWQNTAANTENEEQYLNMSGTMERKMKRDVRFIRSKNTSPTTEKCVRENGFLVSSDNPLKAGMINNRDSPSPANIISPFPKDVQHQNGEDFSQCQITKANAMKEQYTDMSGILKKRQRDAKFVKSRAFATEKDIEENLYLNLNVSQVRVTNDELPESFKRSESCDFNHVATIGQALRDISTHSRPFDNAARCGDIQRSLHEDTLSTSSQSTPIREPPDGQDYPSIDRNDTSDPPAMDHNDSQYSVSIHSSKKREESELDENGYLILETRTDENVEDQYANIDKIQPATSFFEGEHSPGTNLHIFKNPEDQIDTAIYDNIPNIHGLEML
ncbi:uncharacterized protein [Diadema antillarum]|uniref:uncharacterized protein n=1 Tax=Diadema antillarum TaxID=105358 RepID=UPI003A8BA6D8